MTQERFKKDDPVYVDAGDDVAGPPPHTFVRVSDLAPFETVVLDRDGNFHYVPDALVKPSNF